MCFLHGEPCRLSGFGEFWQCAFLFFLFHSFSSIYSFDHDVYTHLAKCLVCDDRRVAEPYRWEEVSNVTSLRFTYAMRNDDTDDINNSIVNHTIIPILAFCLRWKSGSVHDVNGNVMSCGCEGFAVDTVQDLIVPSNLNRAFLKKITELGMVIMSQVPAILAAYRTAYAQRRARERESYRVR